MTTLFVKARVQAFQDIPNLFALPQPNMDELVPVEELEKYTKQEYTTRLMEAGHCLRIKPSSILTDGRTQSTLHKYRHHAEENTW